MVLWLIGLGLGDADDITVKGLKAMKESAHIYLEAYTSILPGLDKETLAEKYGVESIIEADREFVESGCEGMLEQAKTEQVSFLVVGDPLCATTHTDLMLRARELEIQVRVSHNASVMNAIATTGLQLYRFGETISIPYWQGSWKPTSFYDKLIANNKANLHTLCLLDIKVKEVSNENMMRRKKIYEPPRFMSVDEAISQLAAIEKKQKADVATAETKMVGVARLGREDQQVVFGTRDELAKVDLGGPLHSLVICAPELHDCELEFLEHFKAKTADDTKTEESKAADSAEQEQSAEAAAATGGYGGS